MKGKKVVEARMWVGQSRLTTGEAATVRAALNAYISDMYSNGLGDDEHGKAMADAYLKNAHSVLSRMHADIEKQRG